MLVCDGGFWERSSPDLYVHFLTHPWSGVGGVGLEDTGKGWPYCGDLGGVCWGSLLGVFPGCGGGGEAHRPAGLRASLGGLPEVAEPGLEEGGYVSLGLASPARTEVSGHFLSSPAGAAQAGLASLVAGGSCEAWASFTRWQISA